MDLTRRQFIAKTGTAAAGVAFAGLAMVSMSERAWEAYKGARMPRYYWDLGQARRWLERGQTLATPAISIYFALRLRDTFGSSGM